MAEIGTSCSGSKGSKDTVGMRPSDRAEVEDSDAKSDNGHERVDEEQSTTSCVEFSQKRQSCILQRNWQQFQSPSLQGFHVFFKQAFKHPPH